MGIAVLGILTVVAAQVAATRAQQQGRDMHAARALGESFMTRLRGESMNWATSSDISAGNTPLLWYGLNAGTGQWVAVPSYSGTTSPRHNSLGIPDDASDPRVAGVQSRVARYNQRYCIHYAVDWVGTAIVPNELLRTQVRVFWPITDDAFAPAPRGVPDCGMSDPVAMVSRRAQFRFIQMTSVVFRHGGF